MCERSQLGSLLILPSADLKIHFTLMVVTSCRLPGVARAADGSQTPPVTLGEGETLSIMVCVDVRMPALCVETPLCESLRSC